MLGRKDMAVRALAVSITSLGYPLSKIIISMKRMLMDIPDSYIHPP
jgi:hypothetical protein